MDFRFRPLSLSLAACALLPLAGCHVSEHKNGGGDKVDISTPFASMHVKTDKEADTAGIGLAVYPGAVPVKDKDDKDNDAADVNMSFGDFHLGVKAASFQTSDSPDKVEAFYRKELARYGDVIKCHGDQTIGQPTRTAEGLTCKDDDSGKHSGSAHYNYSSDHDTDLKAGTPTHQHIVGFEPKQGGTRIGLVMLDLPKGLSKHGSSDSE